MNEAFACIFAPGPCITGLATGAADTILSLFPFGLYGLVFLAGMIVGERIGLWGILIGIIGWIAIRFGSSVQVAHPDNPAQPTKRALTADEVRKLQAALNALGHNVGPVDGKPGKLTIAAIRQYQVSRREIATGIPTAAQLKHLRVWK